jgi:hypothetical protein
VTAQAAQQSMLSLYHDLGVLVFAGCDPKQTDRIGDILRQVVGWGGPGGAVSRLSWVGENGHETVNALDVEDLHETVDDSKVRLFFSFHFWTYL